MKFLADMPVSPKTVEKLCEKGYDAVHLFSLGMKKADDEEVVEFAKQENRIILTMDLGFGEILAHSKEQRPGVIIFRVSHSTPTKVNSLLFDLLNSEASSDIEGSIIIIEEARVRIRKLPIQQ